MHHKENDKNTNEELERFFSISLDMLCISSADGYFKRVNPAFETVLGHTSEYMCTTPYLSIVHPDDIEKTSKEVEKQMIAGQKVLSFENRYRCKDGSYKLLSWKSVPMGDLMYAAARDVTEISEAHKQIQKLNIELESFSYSVSHDLRAPLRSMMGFSKIILEDHGAELNPSAKDSLQRVINAAEKMGQLVDGLLDLSRLNRAPLFKDAVNLSHLAQEIGTELKGKEPSRNVHFSITNNVIVSGDLRLLRVVMTNLIYNAWKFTSKKEEGQIEFGVTENKGIKAFYLRDNGSGFDKRHIGKLFGTFQRLHTTNEFPGTGIGLATVQRIIHRHGGEIWADSVLNEGATFYFTI